MLKQTVAFTDFDDNESQETLYFNLTKSELADNLHLQDELEQIQKKITGEGRMQAAEIRAMLEVVKTFMRISYGVRSSDGKRFMKSEEQWKEFSETAAYDAFLFGLFEDPGKALAFMTGILPKGLREAALEEAKKIGAVPEGLDIPKADPSPTYEQLVANVDLPEVITKKSDFDKPLGTPNNTVEAAPGSEDELAAFRKWQQEQNK